MPIGTAVHERTFPLCESLNYREWSGYYAVSAYEAHHEHEYNAIRNAAALIDISPLFKYRISGKDATRLVDRIVTRDLRKVKPGSVIYTPWCDEHGKVIDDGTVARLSENVYRWTAADPSLRWFQQNALGLDVTVEDVSDEIAALALQGPTSGRMLKAIAEADIENLKYFKVTSGKIAGVPVDISRTGYTGDLGYEIWIPWKDAVKVWDELMAKGKAFDIHAAGMLALDVSRVEAGLLLIDVDFHGSKKAYIDIQRYSPFEMGLTRLVALDKGRFVGPGRSARGSEEGAGPPDRGPRDRLGFDRKDLRPPLPRAAGPGGRLADGGARLPRRRVGRQGDFDDVVADSQEDDRPRDRGPRRQRRRHPAGDGVHRGSRSEQGRRDRRRDALLQPRAQDRDAGSLRDAIKEDRMPPFDMSLVQRGARNRRTPYYEATQRSSPKAFTVYNHMYFPVRFDTFENEFQALLNDVTIWDVSVERCIEVSGPDGFKFAQLVTPRNLSKCAVGQGKYVLICDSDGGVINDPVMTRMDENTFWFALASSDVLLFFKGLKNAYPKLNVTIRELDVAPLQVQGPKSKDLMKDLLGESILDLKYYFWRKAEIKGVPVVITRTGWTSEVGYEVYLLDPTKGSVIWDTLLEVGKKYNVKPTGPSDIRRVEGGILNWGADMTYENNALQLGLERLVDFSLPEDACISVGALKKIKAQGVKKRLVGVELDGEPFPALNNVKWPAHKDGGGRVGKVTSAIYSPRLKKNIGYCWMPTEMAKDGTKLKVETEWGPRTATVVPMPFIDPDKRIPVS